MIEVAIADPAWTAALPEAAALALESIRDSATSTPRSPEQRAGRNATMRSAAGSPTPALGGMSPVPQMNDCGVAVCSRLPTESRYGSSVERARIVGRRATWPRTSGAIASPTLRTR